MNYVCADIIRLDKIRLQVDLSRRTLVHRRQREALSALSIGKVVEGYVMEIKPNGVIVNLGFINGFLHITDMAEEPPGHPSDPFEVDQHLITRVSGLDVPQRRVTLTMRSIQTTEAPAE